MPGSEVFTFGNLFLTNLDDNSPLSRYAWDFGPQSCEAQTLCLAGSWRICTCGCSVVAVLVAALRPPLVRYLCRFYPRDGYMCKVAIEEEHGDVKRDGYRLGACHDATI